MVTFLSPYGDTECLTVVETGDRNERSAWVVLDARGQPWWYASTLEEAAYAAATYLMYGLWTLEVPPIFFDPAT